MNLLSQCFFALCALCLGGASPLCTTDRRLPAGHQPRNGARPAVVRRATHAARRHHARRDRGGAGRRFANPGAREARQVSIVYPVADGATEMTVEFGGQTVKVPVKVEKAKEDRPICFKLDVMPVFMRAGCNAGGCHGAARGKDGFRLSLFGFDPDGDHYRLTRELNGRRINLALPAESLLHREGDRQGAAHRRQADQAKATSTTRRSSAGSKPARRTTRRPSPRRSSMEVFPPARRARRQGREAADRRAGEVLRRHRPRCDRAWRSSCRNNDNAAKIDGDGDGHGRRARRSVRHGPLRTPSPSASPFIVLPKGLQFAWPERAREQLHRHARPRRSSRSCASSRRGSAPTRQFVRRVYLDIVGVLPTPEEYARFMAEHAAEQARACSSMNCSTARSSPSCG